MSKHSFAVSVLLAGLLLVGLLTYWPGISGPFLFDDFPNLSDLGLFGGVHDFQSALRFILGGNAGPLGRPISLASFLLNDNAWPSQPRAFKYTNLLLHLLSGTLLFTFLRQLQLREKTLSVESRDWIALSATGIWLLHPIQAAPVFLVIQRMTILSALFSFAALSIWLSGRNRAAAGRRGGWWLMSLSIVLGGSLATLSKENGVLLAPLILVMERTLAPLPATRHASIWRLIFLILPSAAIASYFVFDWCGIVAGYAGRDFTLRERLLTEPLILLDYLREIFNPGITTTIFRDDFPVTTQWMPMALPAIAAWCLAVIVAIYARARFPVAAFAILFFVVGQLLESGPIPLELYFIHRNYLPMIGVVFAAAYYTAIYLGRNPSISIACAIGVLLVLSITTRVESFYWGQEDLLVNAWADERPASPRAAAMAANYWGQRGDYARASAIIERTLALHPDSLSLRAGNYYEHCLTHTEDRSRWNELVATVPSAARDNAFTDVLDVLALNIRHKSCTEIQLPDIVTVLDLLKSNPHYANGTDQARIDYTLALYFLELDQRAAAIGVLEQATKASPTVYEFELLGDLYAEAGQPGLAIDNYRSALAIPFFRGWRAMLFGTERPSFEVLQQKLKALEDKQQKSGP